MRQLTQTVRVSVLALAMTTAVVLPARAQRQDIQIGGYAMVGLFTFAASESFDAVLGTHSGPIFGGGATVGLPLGGLFVDIGAWRYSDSGERVLVLDDEVIPLGIPVDVTIVPLEISAGWKFRLRKLPKLIPYVAGGYTSFSYQETSSFAGTDEDTDDQFGGFHLRGGAEFKLTRWLGVAGEVAWTTVPDGLGSGGVSDTFNETDLGGTSFRARITIGR